MGIPGFEEISWPIPYQAIRRLAIARKDLAGPANIYPGDIDDEIISGY
jgi:hypothetical protein